LFALAATVCLLAVVSLAGCAGKPASPSDSAAKQHAESPNGTVTSTTSGSNADDSEAEYAVMEPSVMAGSDGPMAEGQGGEGMPSMASGDGEYASKKDASKPMDDFGGADMDEKSVAPEKPKREEVLEQAPDETVLIDETVLDQTNCSRAELEPKELFLSADDSNSQASAAVAARLIEKGRFVPGGSVRTYEFLNYYDLGYENGDTLKVVPQARAVAGRERAWTLQIGAVAPKMDVSERRLLNLTLVIDLSGSMAGTGDKAIRGVIEALAHQLKKGDLVSVIGFNVTHELLLEAHEIDGPDDAKFLAVLDAVKPNQRTDLQGAIVAAYDLARKNHSERRLNRVMLISDGNTNTGQQSLDRINAEANQAEDKAIFLLGVAVGEAYGLNYQLMDSFTDAGKGAFVFVDSKAEAERLFGEHFMANMEVAAEDVRAKVILPPGFRVEVFHGEQMSTVASEVVPQNLAPNDAMIYHMVITSCLTPTGSEEFVVEAEYTDSKTHKREVARNEITLAAMLRDGSPQLVKGDALVAYAEALKEIDDLRASRPEEAVTRCKSALDAVNEAVSSLKDDELKDVSKLLDRYCDTVEKGETINGVCDCGQDLTINQALGLCSGEDASPAVTLTPSRDAGTVAMLSRLRDAGPSFSPREGCQMLAISSGKVGEPDIINSTAFGPAQDPIPTWIGDSQSGGPDGAAINDLSTVTLDLTAPRTAKSFSFDFAYLSGEFPNYVGSAYNDTFYATIEAASTHDGERTNVAFDGSGRSIEINNNYFQNEYHPCREWGTGFDRREGGGSTCWLQTSWPIKGGERFKLTFSIHDEGDGVYASEVLLDNFQWHEHEAVGATDPIN